MALRTFTAFLVAALAVGGARAEEPAARCDGRPDFGAAEKLGYWVWREGDRWSVRWTTLGGTRFFAGVIEAVGGDLKDLDRVDVERESRVLRSGRPGRTWVGPRGRVHVRPGRTPVVATREEDKIAKDGDQRIVWSSRTEADIDGFDFDVGRHVTRLRFTLRLDDRTLAADVALGESALAPLANPFEVALE
jgi:hypothetical protein